MHGGILTGIITKSQSAAVPSSAKSTSAAILAACPTITIYKNTEFKEEEILGRAGQLPRRD